MLPNVPYFAFVYYGVLRAGAVVVPMNPPLKEREVAFYLGDPEAKLFFAWHQFADAAHAGAEAAGAECVLVEPGNFESLIGRAEPRRDVVEHAGDDTAVILHTFGTTGRPKGAELTHGNFGSNTEAARGLLAATAASIALGALPVFHSFGQTCGLNLMMSVGGCLTLLPRFDAGRALEIIERDRVTLVEGVPTMFAYEGEVDASRLELCASGGAAMPLDVMRRFEERFGCIVLEGYGLSETSRSLPSAALTVSASPDQLVADRRRREAGRRRRRRRGATGRGRRDRDSSPQRHEGVLAAPRGHGGGDRPGRLVSRPEASAARTKMATSTSSTTRRR
jgi:long-chain acyl-CoA synthetase